MQHQPVVPVSMKRLIACKTCKLIKNHHQFIKDGCENCFSNKEKDIFNLTTLHFAGLICIVDNEHSWVSKWQGIQNLHPGAYAIDVKTDE